MIAQPLRRVTMQNRTEASVDTAKWRISVGTGTNGQKGFSIYAGATRICVIHKNDARDNGQKSYWARLIAAAPELLDAINSLLEKGLNRKTVEQAALVVNRIQANEV